MMNEEGRITAQVVADASLTDPAGHEEESLFECDSRESNASAGLDTRGYMREGEWSDPADLWIAGVNAPVESPISVRRSAYFCGEYVTPSVMC